ncbi:uncharacterized protein TNCV_4088941 [Trichonephila clavipes]|nr:uncharacterized protein TNCV_4088941 [Trichonephila clavipes]
MVELLCNHIEENISSLFVCFGCLEGYENQLGHECMTYSNGQRISEYGDLAILNMDWDKLVADFCQSKHQMKSNSLQSKDLSGEIIQGTFYPQELQKYPILDFILLKKLIEQGKRNASFPIIYAYCDLVEPQIVSHTQAPLLKIIKVEGKDGEVVNAHYTRPHYVPVIRQQFKRLK